jgi:hypothetical protein
MFSLALIVVSSTRFASSALPNLNCLLKNIPVF